MTNTGVGTLGVLLGLGLAVLAGCKPAADQAASRPAAPAPDASAEVVATIDGTPITMKELKEQSKQDMLQLERRQASERHQLLRQSLENLIAKRLVEEEAAKRNLSTEALLQAEVYERTAPPSVQELQAFYAENRSQLQGQTLEQVRPELAQYMRQRKAQENLVAYVKGLGDKRKIEVTLPPPELPRVEVAADGPARGPENAPVTVVVFSDFQCPYCSKAVPVLDEIARTYPEKVRVVFRDFPLPNHAQAPKAGEAGHCAAAQGKFWELHDAMFANQDKLSVDGLKQLAHQIPGLDAAQFDQCLESGTMGERVTKNAEAGREVGVTGTPTFFVNGQMIGGAQDFAVFKQLIERELRRSGA